MRKFVATALTVGMVSAGALMPSAADAATVKTYKNCAALNKVYKHGVGKNGAKDKTSGKPVTNFKVSASLHNANKKLDHDKDGIACEKA
jgi:hypothetical protein